MSCSQGMSAILSFSSSVLAFDLAFPKSKILYNNNIIRSIKTRVSDPHFFADPHPGKNLHADPDPDPGGIWGRGLGVKGKMNFFFIFFHVSDDS